jgi:hypothetical protein
LHRAVAWVGHLGQGQAKSRCFPCACLRQSDEITFIFQQERDDFFLYRGGLDKPHFCDSTQYLGAKPHFMKI